MLVMKFGGASVVAPESFLKIADLIIENTQSGEQVVVVMSAMGHTTDQLLDLARQVHQNPPRRELDMLISSGERISCALLAMALQSKGVSALSFTGSQAGIITTNRHTEAKIVDVRPHRLRAALDAKQVPIVAGFQGVSREGNVTTLGRGGSDITAVALAAALGSPRVAFYKDVPGVFASDPKVDAEALHFPRMSYREALEIMQGGAKVLQVRSVALAERNGILLSVQSFQQPKGEGTWIGAEEAVLCRTVSFETEGEHVG